MMAVTAGRRHRVCARQFVDTPHHALIFAIKDVTMKNKLRNLRSPKS